VLIAQLVIKKRHPLYKPYNPGQPGKTRQANQPKQPFSFNSLLMLFFAG
jgi:hypothetical protein